MSGTGTWGRQIISEEEKSFYISRQLLVWKADCTPEDILRAEKGGGWKFLDTQVEGLMRTAGPHEGGECRIDWEGEPELSWGEGESGENDLCSCGGGKE